MDEHLSTNESTSLPSYLKFSDNYAHSIISLGVVFLIGALGNIAFFVTLLCSKNRKSPTNFFLLHLSSADLLVMFVIPVGEMIHNATIAWLGGNFLCKLYHFLWNFGQYVTTFLLCCISIDRYLAFVFPLRSLTQSPRTRSFMAATAWVLSAILSAPEVSVSYTSQWCAQSSRHSLILNVRLWCYIAMTRTIKNGTWLALVIDQHSKLSPWEICT